MKQQNTYAEHDISFGLGDGDPGFPVWFFSMSILMK